MVDLVFALGRTYTACSALPRQRRTGRLYKNTLGGIPPTNLHDMRTLSTKARISKRSIVPSLFISAAQVS